MSEPLARVLACVLVLTIIGRAVRVYCRNRRNDVEVANYFGRAAAELVDAEDSHVGVATPAGGQPGGATPCHHSAGQRGTAW